MNCKTWAAAAALGATILSVPLASGTAQAASVYPSNAPVAGIAATPDGNGYWQVAWTQRNGKFSTNTSLLQVGDVVFYAQHVGVVIQVQPNGTVVTADGDFGGTGKPEAAFASTSHVKIDSFNPRYGQGAAGSITGIGLIG